MLYHCAHVHRLEAPGHLFGIGVWVMNVKPSLHRPPPPKGFGWWKRGTSRAPLGTVPAIVSLPSGWTHKFTHLPLGSDYPEENQSREDNIIVPFPHVVLFSPVFLWPCGHFSSLSFQPPSPI